MICLTCAEKSAGKFPTFWRIFGYGTRQIWARGDWLERINFMKQFWNQPEKDP